MGIHSEILGSRTHGASGNPRFEPVSVPGDGIPRAHRKNVAGLIIGAGTVLGSNTPWASGSVENPDIWKSPINRVCKARGKAYFVIGGSVYVYDQEIDEEWRPSISLNGTRDIEGRNTGIYPVIITGVPHLILAHQQGASSTWQGLRYNLVTETWSSGVTASLFQLDDKRGVTAEILHNNRLYFVGTQSQMAYFDPANNQLTNVTIGDSVDPPIDLCTFRNQLYFLAQNNTDNEYQIHQVQGSNTAKVIAVGTAANGFPPVQTLNREGRFSLFVDNFFQDPGRLVANIVYKTATNQFATVLELSDANGDIGFQKEYSSWNTSPLTSTESGLYRVLADSQSLFDVGTPAGDVNLYQMAGALDGPGEQGYRYNGEAGGTLFHNIVTQWAQAWSHEKIGGGSRYFQRNELFLGAGNGQADIVLRNVASGVSPNRLTLTYELLPTPAQPAGTPVAIRWFFDDRGHQPK